MTKTNYQSEGRATNERVYSMSSDTIYRLEDYLQKEQQKPFPVSWTLPAVEDYTPFFVEWERDLVGGEVGPMSMDVTNVDSTELMRVVVDLEKFDKLTAQYRPIDWPFNLCDQDQ